MSFLAQLPERAVIAVAGEDRVAFLQGLVSNDVAIAAPGRCVWAALLTPQGKWLADFFIFAEGERLLLDCERGQIGMLIQRLSRYRLRMRVSLAEQPDLAVYVAWDGEAATDLVLAAPDPRLPGFAVRMISTKPLRATATAADWDRARLCAGLPEGSRDLEAEHSILLEAGFDELNGVSWTKGCYMGQELTARTKYRGLVKRRLVSVTINGPSPAAGTPVLRGDLEVGSMRSSQAGIGLASVRVDALTGPLLCGGSRLTPQIPPWMRLPDMAKAAD
jgi:folate-binding protein YgfZ